MTTMMTFVQTFRYWLRDLGRASSRRPRGPRRLGFDPLEQRAMLTGIPELVRDINLSGASNPTGSVDVGGTLFFRATDGTNGAELWKSDGTSAGTVLVKDIVPGGVAGYPQNLINVNGTLFFTAFDSTNGEELWKSNGTSAGTVLVKDIRPGSSGSSIRYLTNVNGTLYFRATEGINGLELWKSDGTSTGTVLVKDINTAGYGSASANPQHLTNVNGTLYFAASTSTGDYDLWKSDGTNTGTVLVKDINPNSTSATPQRLTNVNGTLYFRAFDDSNAGELWKSDGTSSGTVLVKDINPGANSSDPQYLTNVNGTLYFQATDGTNGYELWKSDGTSTGTVLVKDIQPGGSGSILRSLTNVNGTLFFRANDGSNGTELWKSNGTSAGTVLVKDIKLGTNSANPQYLTNVNGTLYFMADDATNGYELWKSDGTSAGTVLVHNISSGGGSSIPRSLTNVNGKLFFSANDDVTGHELWRLTPSAFAISGGTVTVTGGNEVNNVTIVFSSPTNYTITRDGVSEAFSTTAYPTIIVDTGGGNDTLTAALSTLADTATFSGLTGTVTSSNYSLSFANIEVKYVFGDSTDSATFNDTPGNDYFWALPAYSIMSASDFSYLNEVIGFGPSIVANATNGDDLSQLYGDSGVQNYVGNPTGNTLSGSTVSFSSSGFDQNYAYSFGGNDTVTLNGSAGNDTVYALSAYTIMLGPGVFQYVVGYPSVTANAGGGAFDVALLYDTAGNDTLTGSSNTVVMTGAGFSNRVNAFDQVHAYASAGIDNATLDGSTGDDVFYGENFISQLFATGVYFIQTYSFDLTHANLSIGTGADVALLYDGTGNDQLTASGNQAELLYADGTRNRVNAFDAVYAYSQNGGTNRRTVTNPLAYGLVFNGTWV